MIVVIDGYNVLRQVFAGIKGPLEKQRVLFIRQLGYYLHKKANDIKEIVLVFDAGPFGHATREVKNGVVVIFSGQRSNADEWIIDFTKRKKHEDLLVVTMDRKLIDACGKNGASAINSIEFYKIMQNSILEDAYATEQPSQNYHQQHGFEKYESIELDNEHPSTVAARKTLDLLMEQECFYSQKNIVKDDHEEKTHKSKGSTLSKDEKKAYAKLKKLR